MPAYSRQLVTSDVDRVPTKQGKRIWNPISSSPTRQKVVHNAPDFMLDISHRTVCINHFYAPGFLPRDGEIATADPLMESDTLRFKTSSS
jgi:hypothetical protein